MQERLSSVDAVRSAGSSGGPLDASLNARRSVRRVSWRERESQKQARSREENESTALRTHRPPADGNDGPFRCECGNHQCTREVTLTLTEYELVRASATHFAVARNHENPESEQVIHENERFAVVETVTGHATKLARRSDPRQRRRDSRWRRAGRLEKRLRDNAHV